MLEPVGECSWILDDGGPGSGLARLVRKYDEADQDASTKLMRSCESYMVSNVGIRDVRAGRTSLP